jgi:hypothetical protein
MGVLVMMVMVPTMMIMEVIKLELSLNLIN